ncbi:MAG: hypothetical protein QOF48_2894 [Verrucomicrobiota bacterium]|jgi:uncharacterized repeat protein (TIGR04138 family)
MHTANFEEALDEILRKDRRYHRDAYRFVREALDHTQKTVAKSSREGSRSDTDEERHVSGTELLEGIRVHALGQFGPMTLTVLQEWGLNRCADFGEIVFNMIEIKSFKKTDKDSREDFKPGYDFEEAFRKPFLPAAKRPPRETEPRS